MAFHTGTLDRRKGNYDYIVECCGFIDGLDWIELVGFENVYNTLNRVKLYITFFL